MDMVQRPASPQTPTGNASIYVVVLKQHVYSTGAKEEIGNNAPKEPPVLMQNSTMLLDEYKVLLLCDKSFDVFCLREFCGSEYGIVMHYKPKVVGVPC
jgi:hypothetical protein